MKKLIKQNKKIWFTSVIGIIVASIVVAVCAITFSRYFEAAINASELQFAPWQIAINEQKITSAGEVEIVTQPTVTSYATTGTYQKKIVPGCKGYFDLYIDPAGTGVGVEYEIDFKPEKLPGGMKYTKYEKRDEGGSVLETQESFPADYKITGTIDLVDGGLLGKDDGIRYRIYWDYEDNDELNTTAPDVSNQNDMMMKIKLRQAV